MYLRIKNLLRFKLILMLKEKLIEIVQFHLIQSNLSYATKASIQENEKKKIMGTVVQIQ